MMAEVPGEAPRRARVRSPLLLLARVGVAPGEAKLASAMQPSAASRDRHDKEGTEVVAPLQLFLEAQLGDRGAAEEVVNGIDSEVRSSTTSPCSHRGWSACGAADDVRSAKAHAEHASM